MIQSQFKFGQFTLYLYGLFIFFGVLSAYLLSQKRLSSKKIKNLDLEVLFLLIVLFGAIGARIYHVLSWFSYYRLFPNEIFYFWQGGLGIFGSLILGTFAVSLYSRIKKINFLDLFDLLSPGILLGQAIGRIGNYFNQEVLGPPTTLPWRVYLPPDKRPINFLQYSYFHPTCLYESLLCFLGFLLVIYLERKRKKTRGFSFGLYLIFYGLIRFFTEFLRFDVWIINGIKVSQIISLVFIATGLLFVKNGIPGKKLLKLG